jgi:hypothetical protein
MRGIWVPRTVQDFFARYWSRKIRHCHISPKKNQRSSPYDVRLPAKSANWKQYQSSYLR